jgi:hypothetical protein
MSHDKIKAAARKRMAEKGEPYAVARREDSREHRSGPYASALSPGDIKAAAEVHRELGPEYSDAVVASFIDKVDREVAARVEARLAGTPQAQAPARYRRGGRPARRRVIRDVLAAGAGALAVVGAVGLHGIASPRPGPHPEPRAASRITHARAYQQFKAEFLGTQ